METKGRKSITESIEHAIEIGYQIPAGVTPIQSELKNISSLIGMAYLNYIYQNDLENPHFCETMLLMHSQITPDTENPYVHLFDPDRASKTMSILEDIQLAFDYSISRTNLSTEKIRTSVSNIQNALM